MNKQKTVKIFDLSIIIVSFNTRELLLSCLESILKTVKKSSYEIIVVDNGSSDGTVDALLRTSWKNLVVIANKENLGFSKANNIGVKRAKSRYILFLNPDTLVFEGTIDGMVEFMDSQKDAGAATCFVELPNGKIDDASHRGFPTPLRAFFHLSHISDLFPKSSFFNGYHLGYQNLDKVHEIEACAGAFLMVREEAGCEIGWWDEDFFWYGEDIDFCYRLKEKGWKIYFVPDFKIIHYKGVSGGIKSISKHLSTASKQTQHRARRARFEAMRLFYNKHCRSRYPRIVNLIVDLGIFLLEKLAG
jgi:hypothetical protein